VGLRALVPTLALVLAVTALACGSDEEEESAQQTESSAVEPEATLTPPEDADVRDPVSARQKLVDAQQQLKSLARKVEDKREGVESAKEKLATAREELAKAQDELQRVSREVDDRETNVALFRVVQGALLENEALDDVAIRVAVSHGTVTLHGRVESREQEREAIETARSAAGIFDVDSRIELLGGGAGSGGSGSAGSKGSNATRESEGSAGSRKSG